MTSLAVGRRALLNAHEMRHVLVSNWTERNRVMGMPYPGYYRFEHTPWTKELHDTSHERIVVRKAAQTGFTEAALNRCLHALSGGRSALYVLPTEHDAGDFVASRLDPAIEAMPALRDRLKVSNSGLKRVGKAAMFVRGSRVRSRLQSIAVPVIVIDELDECDLTTLDEAGVWERAEGQPVKQRLRFVLSTPTVEGYGIDQYWAMSSQARFEFPCPACSRWIDLEWERNLVPEGTGGLVCHRCHRDLKHERKHEFLAQGAWIHDRAGAPWRGYQLSQLYSATVSPEMVRQAYRVASDLPGAMQSFYNRKLGLPYTARGDRLTSADLQPVAGLQCGLPARPDSLVTMGVDVGKLLHVRISQWQGERKTCLWVGARESFDEVAALISQYKCRRVVIDANPETRQARSLRDAVGGDIVWLAYYQEIEQPIRVHAPSATVRIDRTILMDQVVARITQGNDLLPCDLPSDYASHLKAPARTYEPTNRGMVARWREGSRPDHYFHACVYDEVARMLWKEPARFVSIRGD